MPPVLGPFSLSGALRAVELVRERARRSATALEAAGVSYAIAGGNAVAVWVFRADPDAVRATVDVDILVRRADLDLVKLALAPAGFVYGHTAGLDYFLDGPDGRVRSGIHLLFDGETVRQGELLPNPSVDDSVQAEEYRVLNLRPLVGIKLTAYRDKDRTHLRDMLEVGLIDASWGAYYPPEYAARLQALVDTPGG